MEGRKGKEATGKKWWRRCRSGSGTRYTVDPLIEGHVKGFVQEKVETWEQQKPTFVLYRSIFVKTKSAHLNIQIFFYGCCI